MSIKDPQNEELKALRRQIPLLKSWLTIIFREDFPLPILQDARD